MQNLIPNFAVTALRIQKIGVAKRCENICFDKTNDAFNINQKLIARFKSKVKCFLT